ncbi:hypothetical protein PBY51_018647 [Eleginops maclovinus]|uniref:Uncharacterized protein n=1 Tax=Eleginops maclovinus TaxID=56733 RepID=A0AAN7Y7J6_ELEMC|nr:hypothetical protein PBY51_018647 [Eleginops maclovinus]
MSSCPPLSEICCVAARASVPLLSRAGKKSVLPPPPHFLPPNPGTRQLTQRPPVTSGSDPRTFIKGIWTQTGLSLPTFFIPLMFWEATFPYWRTGRDPRVGFLCLQYGFPPSPPCNTDMESCYRLCKGHRAASRHETTEVAAQRND